jgi:two-component system alkaline phosphatase synthesis response regulator PhoP
MKPKILVADDDDEFAQLLVFNLLSNGCDAFRASNGIEALHLARSRAPDAILLDVLMPDLDGLSVCEILRSQPSTWNTPVFMLSALSRSYADKRNSKARFNGYFQKPVRLSALMQAVRVACEEHREAQEQTKL